MDPTAVNLLLDRIDALEGHVATLERGLGHASLALESTSKLLIDQSNRVNWALNMLEQVFQEVRQMQGRQLPMADPDGDSNMPHPDLEQLNIWTSRLSELVGNRGTVTPEDQSQP